MTSLITDTHQHTPSFIFLNAEFNSNSFLKSNGHQIRLIAGSNFVEWIESYGLEVFPTVDIEKLMQSEMGIKWVESPNQREQLKAIKAMTNSLIEESVHDTIEGTVGADFMIAGFLAQPYMSAISEKYGIPMITAALQPFRPTSSGSASIMPIVPRSTIFLNRWMGLLTERFTWSIAEQTTNTLRSRLGLSPFTARDYSRSTGEVPALYAFSWHVVPPTLDTNSYTTGYWFLDEPFTPPDDLVRFLDDGEPPIYFGFGSMPDSKPSQTLDMISTVLARLNRRGIMIQGWSEMTEYHNNDRLFVLKGAPHSWLFPKMAAVVHHGGAGTSAAGLRAGKPSLILPHMGDQPFWARRLHELGVTPKPLSRHKISVDSLVERLQTLINDQTIQANAAHLGEAIRNEQGIENAVNWIEQYIVTQKIDSV